jgi:predicted metal-binding protein
MDGHDHQSPPPPSDGGAPQASTVPQAGRSSAADMPALIARAVSLGADGAAPLASGDIVTADWVLMKCRYGCPDYGRRRTCPPFTPGTDQFRAVLAGYRCALLVWVEAAGGDDLPTARRRLHQAILDLERAAFLDGSHKAFGMVDGTCLWCPEDQECAPSACRHPQKVRPSVGACGVDAFATAAAAGVPLQVVRERGDAYRLLGLLLVD